MKAIETRYKGYRFRSRLEARWAVFFDALGCVWGYEPEGFELDDGTRYLPDFYIPSLDLWLEIKGQKPSEAELDRVWRLAYGGKAAAVVHGMPLENHGTLVAWDQGDGSSGLSVPTGFLFIVTYNGLCFLLSDGMDRVWGTNECFSTPLALLNAQESAPDDLRAVRALGAARAARFEFGEQG